MALSTDLIAQLVKVTNDSSTTSSTSNSVYGTAKKIGSSWYVQVDGSELYTPIETTATINDGDRVTVTIANHTATVNGNLTDVSASSETVSSVSSSLSSLSGTIDEFGNTYVLKDSYFEVLSSVIQISGSTETINDSTIVIEDGVLKLQGVDFDMLNTTVNTNASEIKAINTVLSTLNSTISIQESTISALSSKIETNESDISTLKSTISTQDSTIQTLSSKIETNESDISTLKSTISTQDSTISTLSSKIETNESTISTIQTSISTINSSIETMDSTLNTYSSTIGIFNSSFQITDDVVTGIVGIDGTSFITTKEITAGLAVIESLEDTYANIDFANIGDAAIKNLYSYTGFIQDITGETGTYTGELNAVRINGNLIYAGTIVADKLVLLGDDGLYYRVNTEGINLVDESMYICDEEGNNLLDEDGNNLYEYEQTIYNAISGDILIAESVTADKISVSDLYAFRATIGGFKITDSAIYSGVKESAFNTTRGIYLDSNGNIAFGDSSNYLRYFLDDDKTWKLQIRAKSISLGTSSTTVEDQLEELNGTVSAIDSSENILHNAKTLVYDNYYAYQYILIWADVEVTTETEVEVEKTDDDGNTYTATEIETTTTTETQEVYLMDESGFILCD